MKICSYLKNKNLYIYYALLLIYNIFPKWGRKREKGVKKMVEKKKTVAKKPVAKKVVKKAPAKKPVAKKKKK